MLQAAGDQDEAAKEKESVDQASAPQNLQLGGAGVGMALMSWRVWTPYFTRVMIPGRLQPSSPPQFPPYLGMMPPFLYPHICHSLLPMDPSSFTHTSP